jgi:hypothetical protein
MRVVRALRFPVPADAPAAPPPFERPAPYEVRLRDGVSDSVLIVGHDRRGEPAIEIRVKQRLVTPQLIAQAREWCYERADVHTLQEV